MDHRLLEIVACPVCKGKLTYDKDNQELICKLIALLTLSKRVFLFCLSQKLAP